MPPGCDLGVAEPDNDEFNEPAYLQRFLEALWRTRTADPLLTMELSVTIARVRAGTSGYQTAATNKVSSWKPTRAWTRVVPPLFPPRSLADVPPPDDKETLAYRALARNTGSSRESTTLEEVR